VKLCTSVQIPSAECLQEREVADSGAQSRICWFSPGRAFGRYDFLVPVRTQSASPSTAARIRRWHARFDREIREIGRFGVVGIGAWIVDTLVYNIFYSHNYILAAVISTTVSATVAFFGNRFWTWRDRPRSSMRREYILYAIFNAIGLLISLCCLWFSHRVLGEWWPHVFHTRLADNIAKQGFGLALGTAFRFWAYRRYVFVALAPSPGSQPDESAVT
jgi:putative flippase GtrA